MCVTQQSRDYRKKIHFDLENFTRARVHIVPRWRTNLPLVIPLGRMIVLLNNLTPDVDIFHMNIVLFKIIISM